MPNSPPTGPASPPAEPRRWHSPAINPAMSDPAALAALKGNDAWARYEEAETAATDAMRQYVANRGAPGPTLAAVAALCRRADAAEKAHHLAFSKPTREA